MSADNMKVVTMDFMVQKDTIVVHSPLNEFILQYKDCGISDTMQTYISSGETSIDNGRYQLISDNSCFSLADYQSTNLSFI